MSQREQNLDHVQNLVNQYLKGEINADYLYDVSRLMGYLESEVDTVIAKQFQGDKKPS